GIALLQVVVHLVRLDLLLIEDLAHHALREIGEAAMPRPRSAAAGMLGEKPCRPQFMRIAELLGLAAGQINEPRLGFQRDCWFAAWSRPTVERGKRTLNHRPFDATLHGLVMQSERLAYGKKRRVFRYASKIRARATRPAASLRDCAIDLNFAVS